MLPYTPEENDWLTATRRRSEVDRPFITDELIRHYLRRGEHERALEVRRVFAALFRLPGRLLTVLSAAAAVSSRRSTG